MIRTLITLLKASSIDKSNLLAALKDRVLVYNGGGSTFPQLTTPIYYFNDVKVVDEEMWEEEQIKDKKKIGKIFNLLTTSYGLSVSGNDSDVVLCDFDKMFEPYKKDTDNEKREIDKDVC